MNGWLLNVALGLGLLGVTSCGVSQATANLAAELTRLRAELAEQRALVALYACRIEFRMMYAEIRKECAMHAKRFGRPAATASCPPEVVQDAITSSQRQLGVQLSDLVREHLHTVIYLGALHEDGTGKGSSHKDTSKAETLHQDRQRILDFALSAPWPSSMRVLLITPPSPPARADQAQRRLEWTKRYLMGRGLQAHRIDPPLIYDLGVTTDSMRPLEQRIPPEMEDPSTAVWIVRLDCPNDASGAY